MSTPVTEHCRHWPPNEDRCDQQAVVIVWGKLFDINELGPRCAAHLPEQVAAQPFMRLDQWAMFDLRGIIREDASDQVASGS